MNDIIVNQSFRIKFNAEENVQQLMHAFIVYFNKRFKLWS